MDEMTMIREALASPPPPAPAVTSHAWQRLAERIAGEGTTLPAASAGRTPGALPRRRSRPGMRWVPALAGVAAASLAGALTVTALLPSGGPQPQGPQRGWVTSERPLGALTGRPAHPYLLSMAAQAAGAQPALGTGRYWCTAVVSGQLDPIGRSGRELVPPGEGLKPSPVRDYRYSVFARQRAVDCLEYRKLPAPGGAIGGYYGDPSANLGGYIQDLGARPATTRDAAAWRGDGSPAWHAWYGGNQLIPARPGPRTRTGGKRGDPAGPLIPLPTDPAKLRAVLLAHQGNSHFTGSPQQVLFWQLRTVLGSPATPALRAAAYQVMAGIPGIQMKPGVKDPAGRPGTALWLGTPGQVIIVDPATGTLLADEWVATRQHGVYAPGTVTQYLLWQRMALLSRVPR